MLKIPDKIKPLVSDYKMNLVEIKKSNTMKFHNDDVNMVFDLSRSIYERNYDKINRVYKDCAIPTEIGLVIGAITESQELINQALEIEKRMGGQMNMCTALEELKKEGIQEGEIKGTIKMSKKFNVSKDDTMKNIINEFSLTKDKAQEYIENRHNNSNKNDLTKYKEYVAKMSEEELEEWYDELYQMILLAFLMIDNVERMEKIKKLKYNINK